MKYVIFFFKKTSLGFIIVQDISLKPCHVLLKQAEEIMSFISDENIVGLRHMTS